MFELKCLINISVSDRPRVSIIVMGSSESAVIRQRRFSLRCAVDAYPSVTIVEWTKNGSPININDLMLEQPTGISADTTYQCRANNSQGLGSSGLTVDAHCKFYYL